MKNRVSYICLILLFCLGFSAQAKILLPRILSDNMVLQRDASINIWGYAQAGERVNVNFAGQTRQAVTDQTGNWSVQLTPLKTSWTAQSMTISGSNTIILTNILVGEVWLCSGQSNMEYAMRKLIKIPKPQNEKLGFPQDEVAEAQNDQIRIFLVNRKTLNKPDSLHHSWSIARDSALRAFSAAGYFFAKELQQKLGVPVGVISSAVSGSAIEPWISKTAFEQAEAFKNEKVGNDPGKFYPTMIEPLTKYRIRGFLWYQGETNCFLNESLSYANKMKTLISSWRKAWGSGDLPFYYVQIAPFNYSKTTGKVILTADTEPQFWEAQTQLLRLPNTGMVSTNDLTDGNEDLHPSYKWEIGRRLALWALAKTYHQKIAYSGPIYKSVTFKGDKAILVFDHAKTQLVKLSRLLLLRASSQSHFSGFTIAGQDGKFVPAVARLQDERLLVYAPGISNPTAVRYNWSENPSGTFFTEGLPALPFRTDNPLTNQFKPD